MNRTKTINNAFFFSGKNRSREDSNSEFIKRPSLATTEALENLLSLSTRRGEDLTLYTRLIDQDPEDVGVRNLVLDDMSIGGTETGNNERPTPLKQ